MEMEKAIHLIPGMRLKVSNVIDVGEGKTGAGSFASQRTSIDFAGGTLALTRGFAIDDDKVGTLEVTTEDEPAVIYTHNKPQKNIIYYFDIEDNVTTLSIVGVPIHDHSSIIQGGPAFGSYFTDDQVVE